MSYKITEDCINCNACVEECPNDAIFEAGANWTLGDKSFGEGETFEGIEPNWSADYYYIVPGKCTECKGFYDEPQCINVCPVDSIVKDPEHEEGEDTLIKKKEYLDSTGR